MTLHRHGRCRRDARYVIAYVLEHCPDEFEMLIKFVDKGSLFERLKPCCNFPVPPRFSTPRQLEILQEAVKAGQSIPVEWGIDLLRPSTSATSPTALWKPILSLIIQQK